MEFSNTYSQELKGGESSVVFTGKSKIISVSNSEQTTYRVITKNVFKHKKGQELTPKIVLHSIQTLIDETQDYLRTKNINDVSPIVYLLNIHKMEDLKNVCEETGLEESELISAFLENTFETNFGGLLKEVLINLCIIGKVEKEKILSFFDTKEKYQLDLLLTER